MTSLVALAADFLERMGNPAFGIRLNEEYAMRLSFLLGGDVDERLGAEMSELNDVDLLTPTGWLWVLGWSRAHHVRLDDELLHGLVERWEASTFKAEVIQTAIDGLNEEAAQAWLDDLVARATGQDVTDEPDDAATSADDVGLVLLGDDAAAGRRALRPSAQRRGSQHPSSLVLALIACDRDPAIDAAARLLRQRWAGADGLARSFWARVDGLDEGSRALWLERLDPPERPDERPARDDRLR